VAVPYVRTVKTASGATVVQIVYFSRRRARDIEHIGSAYGESEAELLKAERGSGLPSATRAVPQIGRRPAAGGSLVITSSRAGHLWDALCRAREVVGFDSAAEGDEAFRQLVLARIIESASEQDSLRVLGRRGLIRRHVPGAPRPARLLRPETIVFAGSRSASGSKTELAGRSSSFLKDGPPLPRATRQSREPRHHCGPNPARRPRRRPQADPPPGSCALI
jgi:hypothetical protein